MTGNGPLAEISEKAPCTIARTAGTVLETKWEAVLGFPGGITLKKTMIAVLAGVMLLTAAMPAFAKKHHQKHHHHHHHAAAQVQ